jgi:hypothetical protein
MEAHHPAVARTLAVAALSAGVRLVCWECNGLTEQDMAFLRRAGSLIYPDTPWVPDVLVSHSTNGLAEVLPERLQPLVKALPADGREAYLYRRGTGQFSRVILAGEA